MSNSTAATTIFLQKSFVSVSFVARPTTYQETNEVTLVAEFATRWVPFLHQGSKAPCLGDGALRNPPPSFPPSAQALVLWLWWLWWLWWLQWLWWLLWLL